MAVENAKRKLKTLLPTVELFRFFIFVFSINTVSEEQPLAAAGRDPGSGRGRLRIGSMSVCWKGQIARIHFGVGWDLLMRCLPLLSPKYPSLSAGRASTGPG